MAWEGSDRRSRLPSDWPHLRVIVLRRDNHRCYLCGGNAAEVDHVNRGDDHSLSNLAAICIPCHRHKTATERPRLARQPERHPGLL